jgi:LPS-assembly protein
LPTTPTAPAHHRRLPLAAALSAAAPAWLALGSWLVAAGVQAQVAAPASAQAAAAATTAGTDEDCSPRPAPRRPPAAAAPSASAPRGGPLSIEADRLVGRTGTGLTASGRVRLQQGGMDMAADSVDYSLADHRARARGQVSLRRGDDVYSGPELELDTETLEGYFLSPRFTIARTQGLGRADRADFLGNNRLQITGASYTTCAAPAGEDPAWVLSASLMRLDFAANDGYAEGAVLRFLDVPILALPVLSFPVNDTRKSGWLPPMLNLSSSAGFEVGVPFYWNIAPQADATLMPTYSPRRGSGLDSELRYLLQQGKGDLRIVALPRDQETARSRWGGRTRYTSDTGSAWGLDLDAVRASDENYWRDGLRGADSLTPRLLGTRAQLSHTRVLRGWGGEVDQTVYAGIQRWQVLQSSDASASVAPPYQRAPQIGAQWRGELGQAELALQTEFNRFTNSDPGLDGGERVHALGSLGWRFSDGAHQLTPRLNFNAASYQLDTPLADGRRRLQRTIPSLSVDSRWTLERQTEMFGRALRQTLEPRLYYLHTPWRDQSELPNYDSAPLDFNATTMFEANSYSGVDRVADAHLVTAGATSRFVDAGSGAELAQVGLAQRFLLSEQRITGDGQPLTRRASDIFVLGSTSAITSWGVESALQYNPESRRIVRSISSVRYTPQPFHSLSATYRLQRGSSEQLALGWQWPLYNARRVELPPTPAAQAVRSAGEQARNHRYAAAGSCSGTLYGVGRLDYSMRDSRLSGAIVGLEYDAGCWIGRLVAERQSTGANASTTRLMLQLELVGLSRLGSNPLAVLKDNIPGYKLLRDPETLSDDGAGNPGRALPAAGDSAPTP